MAQEITHDNMMPNVQAPPIVNMQTYIRITECKILTLDVKSIDTIHDVKWKIQDKMGIPLDQQRLLYSCRELENGRTLSDYNIEYGKSVITLILETEYQKLKNELMII